MKRNDESNPPLPPPHRAPSTGDDWCWWWWKKFALLPLSVCLLFSFVGGSPLPLPAGWLLHYHNYHSYARFKYLLCFSRFWIGIRRSADLKPSHKQHLPTSSNGNGLVRLGLGLSFREVYRPPSHPIRPPLHDVRSPAGRLVRRGGFRSGLRCRFLWLLGKVRVELSFSRVDGRPPNYSGVLHFGCGFS